jgi:SAM-dependent methyltransferase
VVGTRKQLGAWYTPFELVDTVVDAVITPAFVQARGNRPIRVVDPACGDGRFLAAAATRLRSLGATVECVGGDLDASAIAAARSALPDADVRQADALVLDWGTEPFDLVIGNPPFLSQMAGATTRGGSSARGGGPYADVAAEFLALAGELVDPDGGRVAFVLPQSMLASRDAAPIRTAIGERAHMVWSWWSDRRVFDAQVYACAVAFEFGRAEDGQRRSNWSHVITGRQGVPELPDDLAVMAVDGRLADRATGNANFRDEYYGMIPAVGDHPGGPPLVTSGLIDPGRSWWGERPITFARQRYEHPRVELDRLDDHMRRWARRRLVPKVLVANQTRIVEAVCDPCGDWLPGVPVLGVYPLGAHWDDPTGDRSKAELAAAAWEVAAVLTSPFASAWLWHRGAGTGLSASSIRLSPVVLAGLPWPAGDLSGAVAALQSGDVRACGRRVDAAYGLADSTRDALFEWWSALLDRVESRQP